MKSAAPAVEPHFVLAHGFTQTARSWNRMERLLAEALPGSRSTAVDLPGHGDAPAHLDDAHLWDSAAHLVGCGGPGTYIGYSMGGRVTLHAALAHPDVVEAMVLVSATGGIDAESERAERRAADERLAGHIEAIGVSDFLDEWLAKPLFAGLSGESAQIDDRRRNSSAGLAASLRSTGTGTQDPLWDRLAGIEAPALILAGETDTKFRSLGERLARGLPEAELVVIEGGGHSAHLEHPEATVDAIATWVKRRARDRRSS